MKIERNVNGQLMEFELTPEEVSAIYYEQQHMFDIQDIRNKFEGEMDPGEFEDEYGFPVELVLDNESLLEEMAQESRHNQDKHGMDWQFARNDAIKDVLNRHLDELCAEQSEQAAELPSPELPELCFSVLEQSGELVLIKNGETGYYRSDWSTSDPEKNRELADYNNSRLGVTKAQEAAMVAGSIFGWSVPDANPEMYDENGKRKHDSLVSKIASAEQERKDTSSSSKERATQINRE